MGMLASTVGTYVLVETSWAAKAPSFIIVNEAGLWLVCLLLGELVPQSGHKGPGSVCGAIVGEGPHIACSMGVPQTGELCYHRSSMPAERSA